MRAVAAGSARLYVVLRSGATPRRAFGKRIHVAGTVKLHHRHAFVVDGSSATDWPKKLESSSHPVALYEPLAKSGGNVINYTAAEGVVASSGHDVLVFPDNVRFTRVAPEDVNELAHAIATSPSLARFAAGANEQRRKWHAAIVPCPQFFVCAHASRDYRCGSIGPEAIRHFQELGARFDVWGCSHIGKHRLAGNVIACPDGDWYGNVTEYAQVEALVRLHCHESAGTGEGAGLHAPPHPSVRDMWRGRLGLSEQQQRACACGAADASCEGR